MKTTLTLLDPADFIGPEPASQPPSQDQSEPAAEASPVEPSPAEPSPVEASPVEPSPAEPGASQPSAPSSRIRYVGPKIKLAVSIDDETFASEVEAAFKKISQQVRLPGFRPGKAPRRVLEAQLGPNAGRAQALEDSIPRLYSQALRENEIEAVGQPEIEVTAGLEDGSVEFEAVVEVRPQLDVSGYNKLQLELPSPNPTEDEISERIEVTLKQHGELVEVARPAQIGDNVTIDIEGTVNSEPLPGLSAQEYVYEVGSAGIVAQVDEHLTGAVADSTLEFSAPHPVNADVTIDFQITLHKVSQVELPELTDDWVDENTEYDSVEAMRTATVDQLAFGRKLQSNMSMRAEVERLLADLVPGPVPDAMIGGAVTGRIQELASQLQSREMEFEQWLASTGQSPDEFMQKLRDEAEMGVKLNLTLTAIAQAEQLAPSADELAAEFARLAEANNVDVETLMSDAGPGPSPITVKSWLAHNKAMEYVLENAELKDEQGNPLDRADFELSPPSDNQPAENQPAEAEQESDQ